MIDVPRQRRHPKAEPAQLAFVADERARWREHDACFTPRPVARQGVREVAIRAPVNEGMRVIDLGAGAGSIAAEVRANLRPSCLVAVEPRAEERCHLERHADIVEITTAQEYAAARADHVRLTSTDFRPLGFDLAIGNPPWWCWPEIFRAGWSLLAPHGVLAFLGPSTWGHSDESSEGREIFDAFAPVLQLRVARRVAYNGGRGTDNRKCSWWVWRKGYSDLVSVSKGWLAIPLPLLGPEDYHWRTRPGTETP